MSATKKVIKMSLLSATCFLVANSGYHSLRFNTPVTLRNDLNIKITKRLDETFGKVKFGRKAASLGTQSWNRVPVKKVAPRSFGKLVSSDNIKKQQVAVKATPAPAIQNDLDLELTGGIYNKKPLKQGSDFSGNAKVVDGVVEEITVELPGGKHFSINTSERMVGNVFQYEDTNTRELRSGLFYEVKKGTYMITLTDDSQFSGIRLQFSAPESSVIQGRSEDVSWAMNDQNEKQDRQDDDYGYRYDDERDTYEQDAYRAQNYQDTKENVSPYSHSFGV